MVKKQRPLTVEIPSPSDEQPVWSRVGIVAALGFFLGIAWPKLAGVQIGPSVPGEARATPEPAASSAEPSHAAPPPTPPEAATAETDAGASEAAGKAEQLVTVGPGRITRCYDGKGKRVDECGELQFDPVALPRLKELAGCPSAVGLDGKIPIGFELNFEKKEVQVVKGKKTKLPASTVTGVLQCAAREFSNISLDDVPHKYARYSLVYTMSFSPPGKQADAATSKEADDDDSEQAAGTTTSESAATGLAAVSWDTALVRGEPKEGDVVMRLVRGTRVKIVGRQNEWYKIELRGKTGWVYRGAIGL